MPCLYAERKSMSQNELSNANDSPLKSTSGEIVNLDLLAKKVKLSIDDHTATIYNDGFRWHLGASIIGDKCKRKLWYTFRWVAEKSADGRMHRLWNRGHREEERHIEWLRGLGFTVHDRDINNPRADGTFPQIRIQNLVKGHFGGSVDGVIFFPQSWGIDEPLTLSCKTNGTGAGFNSVLKDHISVSKPQHFTQESVYGRSLGITHSLYICANKNDDDLAIQVVKLDFELARQMELKAEEIVFSQTPPARLSENANFFECKNLCEFKDVCHYQKPAVRNCRSCVKCRPVDGAEFYCEQWNGIIPRDVVPKACGEWQSITVGND